MQINVDMYRRRLLIPNSSDESLRPICPIYNNQTPLKHHQPFRSFVRSQTFCGNRLLANSLVEARKICYDGFWVNRLNKLLHDKTSLTHRGVVHTTSRCDDTLCSLKSYERFRSRYPAVPVTLSSCSGPKGKVGPSHLVES